MNTRRWVGISALIFALAWGQAGVDIRVNYPSYLYIATGTDEVRFDFNSNTAPNPGHLSQLDPGLASSYPRYADYIMPAATKAALQGCLGIPTTPAGSYQGQTTPIATAPSACRFAPSDFVPSGLFDAHYKGTGRQHCTDPLYADASLLILSNGPWKVRARLLTPAPSGITLHILPLTFKAPNLRLCKLWPITNPRNHDIQLGSGYKLLSTDPSGSYRRRYAYYTQHAGVYLLPLLFYIQLEPDQVPPLLGTTQSVTVNYIVQTRP